MRQIMGGCQQHACPRQDHQTIDRRRREEGTTDEDQADERPRCEADQTQVQGTSIHVERLNTTRSIAETRSA